MISGSSLHRIAACPTSHALPHVRSISSDATRGTVIHEFLAAIHDVGLDEALKRVPDEHRAACEAIEVSKLPACDPGAYSAEVSFAYDPATGKARELGRGLDRAYASELKGTEVPGTADIIGLSDDPDTVIVMDYKTGYADIPPPDQNWQMRFYALAACRAYGRKKADVTVIKTRDGRPFKVRAILDVIDLDSFEHELKEAFFHAWDAQSTDPVTVGPHCKYCPALTSCPAQGKLVAQLADGDIEKAEWELTPEKARDAYWKIKAAEDLLKQIKTGLALYAVENPVDLGDGQHYELVETSKEQIDGSIAFEVIRKLHGIDAATEAMTPSVTKTAIKDVVRPIAKRTGRTIKDLERMTLNQIRERGGAVKNVTTSVTAHRRKKVKAVATS